MLLNFSFLFLNIILFLINYSMLITDLYECVICCETENRDYRKITSKCTHKAVICLNCVNEYVATSITEFKSDKIKITCPTPQCGKLMEREDIKNIVTDEILERFNESFFFLREILLLTCNFYLDMINFLSILRSNRSQNLCGVPIVGVDKFIKEKVFVLIIMILLIIY